MLVTDTIVVIHLGALVKKKLHTFEIFHEQTLGFNKWRLKGIRQYQKKTPLKKLQPVNLHVHANEIKFEPDRKIKSI